MFTGDGTPGFQPSNDQLMFLRTQYQSLRDEIVKRLETRAQLVSITLVAFATLLGIGVQFRSPDVILIYPPLGLFLAGAWIADERAIRTIAGFIRNMIEETIGFVGWEHFAEQYRHSRPFHIVAIRGIFITSECLATAIAVAMIKPLDAVRIAMNGAGMAPLLTSEYAALLVAFVSVVVTTLELFTIQRIVPKNGDYLKLMKVTTTTKKPSTPNEGNQPTTA